MEEPWEWRLQEVGGGGIEFKTLICQLRAVSENTTQRAKKP